MKRVSTSTADVDKFGTGRNGFTNGDPDTAVPPTQLDESDFDSYQEELARCVEGDGTTLDEDNFHQLDDAVQRASAGSVCALATADYVIGGLAISIAGTSLTVTLGAGTMVFDGRRYVITAAKLLAATANSFLLTASRDTYFYIAPEDPATPDTPPSRDAVYVTTVAVTNGAAAPSTPAGTLLFAMVVTDGTDATSVTYYSRGPSLVDENGTAVRLRPLLGVTTRAALIPPSNATVDLGTDISESVLGHFHTAHVQRIRLKSSGSSLHTFYANERYTTIQATTGGGTLDYTVAEVTAAVLPTGSVARVEAIIIGSNPTDPTDSYSVRLDAHVLQDGGTLSLEGSGQETTGYVREYGNTAIADGVGANFHITSNQLRILLTGHSTDAMRWVIEIHVLATGD
jgi:hypothetical protein